MKIRILHITDVHISNQGIHSVRERIEALIRTLRKENLIPNLIVFTGDAAYRGISEEYELFNKYVVDPLLSEFSLKSNHFAIVPGNHDVNRNTIDRIRQAGLKDFIGKPVEMDAIWNDISQRKALLERQSEFFKFVKSAELFSSSRNIEIENYSIGIACINSAWISAGDRERSNLIISRAQIIESNEEIATADLKVAIWHHPLAWLHDSDASRVRSQVLQHFDICLTGHLHEEDGVQIASPDGDTLIFAGPALHAPTEKGGFMVYEIDLLGKDIGAYGFRWNERTATFVRDTDFANEGLWQRKLKGNQSLPDRVIATKRDVSIAHAELLSIRLNRHLPPVSIGKRELTIDERFLIPNLLTMVGRKERQVGIQEIIQDSQSYIIESLPQSGKTALIERLGQKFSTLGQVAILIDYHRLEVANRGKRGLIDLLTSTLNVAKNKIPGILQTEVVLLIDNCSLNYKDQIWEILNNWREEVPKLRIIAAGRQLSLPQSRDLLTNKWKWISIRPLTIQSVKKELSRLDSLIETKGHPSLNKHTSLATIVTAELPRWPWVILLLFEISHRLSLSDLRTVEGILRQYADLRLGTSESAGAERPKVRAGMLRLLARDMIERRIRIKTVDDVVQLFNEEIASCALDLDGRQLLRELLESQLLRESDEGISFTFFILQEFFHAEHLRETLWSDVSSLKIDDLIRQSGTLALFAEMVRAPQLLKQCITLTKGLKGEDISIEGIIDSLAHLRLPEHGPDEIIAKARSAILREDEVEDMVGSSEENSRGSRERLTLNGGEGMSRLEQFVYAFGTSVAVMRGSRWIEKNLKRQTISEVLELAVCLVAEFADDHELLLAIASNENNSVIRREVAALVNAILVLIVANMLAVLGAGQHLAPMILDMFKEEKDDLKRLMLLMWYIEIGGKDCKGIVQDYVINATHAFCVRLATIWLSGKYIISSSFEDGSKDEFEKLLRVAAEEQARRTSPNSAPAFEIKRKAERIVQAARAAREAQIISGFHIDETNNKG